MIPFASAFVSRWMVLVAAFSIFGLSGVTALAQDRVYKKDGKSIGGNITTIAKQGVQIKERGKNQTVFSGDIQKVSFKGDPSGLVSSRQFFDDGQYERVIEEIAKIDQAKVKRKEVFADASYYVAASKAKLALGGRGSRKAASDALKSFVTENSNSWHFYEAAVLLGDLAMASGDVDGANRFYRTLQKAPSSTNKIRAAIFGAHVAVAKGDSTKAIAEYDKVIGIEAATTEIARLQTHAKIGKATAIAKSGDSTKALKLLDDLVTEFDSSDTVTAAKLFNARGQVFDAVNDPEGAMLSYLRTHLMFSSDPESHALALDRLSDLFAKASNPTRAAELKKLLSDLYPNYAK